MEHLYSSKTSASSLATAITVLAVSLIPSNNYQIPTQESVNYKQYANLGVQKYPFLNAISEENQAEILISFASNLLENIKDMDEDIAKITNEGFWEMYENF